MPARVSSAPAAVAFHTSPWHLLRAFSSRRQRSRSHLAWLQVPQNLATGCSAWQPFKASISCALTVVHT